jgi:hypothetical protein
MQDASITDFVRWSVGGLVCPKIALNAFFSTVCGRIDRKFGKDLQVDLHFQFLLFFLLSSFFNSFSSFSSPSLWNYDLFVFIRQNNILGERDVNNMPYPKGLNFSTRPNFSWSHAKSRKVMQSHAKICKVMQSYVELRKVMHSHAQSSKITQSHAKSGRVKQSHVVSPGVTQIHMESCRVTQSQT